MIQTELVDYAQSEGIVVMGYSPFGSLVMRYGMLFPGPRIDNPILVEIATKYRKTTPQIVLRWLVSLVFYCLWLISRSGCVKN